MRTDTELEVRLNLTIREYARLTKALRKYQDTLGSCDGCQSVSLEIEHLRTKMAEGTLG